ncbi:MAG: M28 family peptidase [Proteobacteria bacterium]|nr:M28 family peptidase [Pseudomonadota bacterium]NIS69158.1 M28 family peptidase [Pseudomonadota bacterium]
MIRMPGKSYRGPMPPLSEQERMLRDALRQDVEKLAGEIGERNLGLYRGLAAAADYLEVSFTKTGSEVHRQEYEVAGMTCANIEVEIPGSDQAGEIVIVGAHYDSVDGSPGANDNATGVAAVLALNRLLAERKASRTLRFVAFANEEPPFFQSSHMGSLVYARHCRRRGEKVVAMLSLETIGYYSDHEGSQHYPFPFGIFYPSTGNFIGFVGNTLSRRLVRDLVASFRRHAKYPSQGGALPGFIPGIGFSDHWAFWQQGYPAAMVTDTAPFRYPYYHTASDTPEKVQYDRMARVVAGLAGVITDIIG